jgi:hypothetical protein
VAGQYRRFTHVAFETLFSTSQAEHAHQLSERVACFLFETITDRLSNYHKVKAACGFRSKVVHGSTLKERNLPDAVTMSEYCDQFPEPSSVDCLPRRPLVSCLNSKPQAFHDRMLSLIFSGKTAKPFQVAVVGLAWFGALLDCSVCSLGCMDAIDGARSSPLRRGNFGSSSGRECLWPPHHVPFWRASTMPTD